MGKDPSKNDKPDPDVDGDDFDADTAKAEIRKKNREAASLRARLKEAEAERDQLKASSNGDQSDTDKINDRIAAAEKRAQEAEATALRWQVAGAKGLTSAQAKRLVGGTLEELEDDADELLAAFKSDAKNDGGGDGKGDDGKGGGGPTQRPKEALKGGSSPAEAPVELDPAKLAESVPRL